MMAAEKRRRSSTLSMLTVGTTGCGILMRTVRKRFTLGSTIEIGAADIRGRFAAAETLRTSICG